MPTRSLAAALADSPAASLLARLEQIQRIGRTLAGAAARVVPDFDACDPRAVALKGNVLILNVFSAAQAAKLRQAVPGLLLHLHQNSVQVTEIQVRVQPALTSYPEQPTTPEPATRPRAAPSGPEGAADAEGTARPPVVAGAQALADTLATTLPDSPLRRAAERLQAAFARRPRS
jgi:hypothetical protein